MLGTFLRSRGAVAGAAIAFLLGGQFVPNLLPQSIFWFPWKFTDIGTLLMLGQALPAELLRPVIATVAWAVILLVLAIWRFEREEL